MADEEIVQKEETSSTKPVDQWTKLEVAAWAKQFVPPQEVSLLQAQEVSGVVLLKVTEQSLLSIGFILGHAVILLTEIEKLKAGRAQVMNLNQTVDDFVRYVKSEGIDVSEGIVNKYLDLKVLCSLSGKMRTMSLECYHYCRNGGYQTRPNVRKEKNKNMKYLNPRHRL